MLSEKCVPDQQSTNGKSLLQAIGKSFYDSIGDIVFGMEDGTVSIFGLVFGVASSTTSSSVVLLAGATGAISAAVSMMAGTFLDVESTNDQAKAQLAHFWMLNRPMTRQKRNWPRSKGRLTPIWKERNRKSGTGCEMPALMTRMRRRSPMRWPSTPGLCSRSRQPLNSIMEVRN